MSESSFLDHPGMPVVEVVFRAGQWLQFPADVVVEERESYWLYVVDPEADRDDPDCARALVAVFPISAVSSIVSRAGIQAGPRAWVR